MKDPWPLNKRLKRQMSESRKAGLLKEIKRALFNLDHDGGSLLAERVQRIKNAIKPMETKNCAVAYKILNFWLFLALLLTSIYMYILAMNIPKPTQCNLVYAFVSHSSKIKISCGANKPADILLL